MRLFKYLLPILMVVSAPALIVAAEHEHHNGQESEHQHQLDDRDLKSLRDFLKTKRLADLLEKSRHLTISGDVHFEWFHTIEKMNGKPLRSNHYRNNDDFPYSRNHFDVEANIILDYETDRTWCTIQTQYSNCAGVEDNCCCCEPGADNGCKDGGCSDAPDRINQLTDKAGLAGYRRFHGSGECDALCLKRAFFGYEIYSDCGTTLDVEIGRRKLYDVFESDIQFLSRFDGIVFQATTQMEYISEAYLKAGAFVVDERVNHYAWAAELALLNIADWGVDFKYSFIDWKKNGSDRCRTRNPKAFCYMNSQAILTYHVDPCLTWGLPTEVYGAFLCNHDAKNAHLPLYKTVDGEPTKIEQDTHIGAKALAWYAGFIIGRVEREGDWSVELEYQWVGEDAVAYDDQNGIGLGDIFANYCNGPGPTQGYKGWQLDLVYAVTDNFTVDTTIQWTRSNQQRRHSFSQVEIEAVYGF